MSYNGSGTFQINSSGQPVVTGTVISSTAFNALTADLATGLSTAITKDGQTTTTVRVPFAQGISSTLVTDATSATTGSIITAGGISTQKALWVGTTTTLAGALTYGGVTLSNAVTGTGNMVLSASPTLTGTLTTGAGIVVTGSDGSSEYLRFTGQSTRRNWQVGNQININDAFEITPSTANGGSTFSTPAISILGSTGGVTLSAALTYGGVTLSNSVTGTGSMVLSAAPTFSGIVNIGAGTGFGGGPLNVYGSTSGNGIISAQQSVAGGYCFYGAAIVNSGSYYYCTFTGGTGGTIVNNGTVTTYSATSDERLKDWTGIVQSDKRQMISDLWLGDFDIYDDFTKTGTPHRGFGVRAQQAYAVLGRQFGMTPPANETDKWQAPSEPFGFLALWGVKDLYAENEALKASMAELTTRLAALENK